MKKLVFLTSLAALVSTTAVAGPFDSEPGTPAWTIPSHMLMDANRRACCDGQTPKDSVIVSVDHSKVPNGAPYRGNATDRSLSY